MNESDALMEVNRALGRLEGKLDSVLSQMTADRSDSDKLRRRVEKLELWRSALAGAWTALVLICGILFKVIAK